MNSENSKYSARRLFLVVVCCLVSAVAGCGASDENGPDGNKPSEVEIFAGERSEANEEAQVRITSPQDNAKLQPGNVSVTLEVKGVDLGVPTQSSRAGEIAASDEGHVHLIVNNKPYMAVYEEGEVKLEGLSPNVYSVFAFPSRFYHESFKNEGASDLVNFCVADPGAGCIERSYDVSDGTPAIFYSRPKDEYRGEEAKKIMLDFYLHNLELSEEGYGAKYTVTREDEAGKEHSITLREWKPAFITGLSPGVYIVRLEVVDGEGQLVEHVDVAYSDGGTEVRKITVAAE